MRNRAVNAYLAIIWAVLALWSARFLFWSWQATLSISFLAALGVRWRERQTVVTLNRWEQRFHGASILVFPALLTLWKTLEQRMGLTDAGGILNRIQHASWAIAMIGLFLPAFKRWWQDLNVLDAAMIAVGFVMTLGVGVELLEAVGKVDVPVLTQAEAFRDTMKDFVSNLVGALAGFVGSWLISDRSGGRWIARIGPIDASNSKTRLKVHEHAKAARYG